MHALFLCLFLFFFHPISLALHPNYIFLSQAANKSLVISESTTLVWVSCCHAGCLTMAALPEKPGPVSLVHLPQSFTTLRTPWVEQGVPRTRITPSTLKGGRVDL